MPIVYSSNSPHILDYLCSMNTREDIQNDPKLCSLLEDPYLKDNMEVALLYSEAQRGTLEAKSDFVTGVLALGPDLDADTIIHYRNLILNDPVYANLAITLGSDIEFINTVRTTTYSKADDDNCFTKPCNYLGPISPNLMGPIDYRNYGNARNFWSQIFRDIFRTDNMKSETDTKTSTGASAVYENTQLQENPASNFQGPLKVEFCNKLQPVQQDGYNQAKVVHGEKLVAQAEDVKGVKSLCGEQFSGSSGDPQAIPRQKLLYDTARANLYSKLGDCYRLMEQMRKCNPYDPKQNESKKPIVPIAPKNTSGLATSEAPELTDASLATPSTKKAIDAREEAATASEATTSVASL